MVKTIKAAVKALFVKKGTISDADCELLGITAEQIIGDPAAALSKGFDPIRKEIGDFESISFQMFNRTLEVVDVTRIISAAAQPEKNFFPHYDFTAANIQQLNASVERIQALTKAYDGLCNSLEQAVKGAKYAKAHPTLFLEIARHRRMVSNLVVRAAAPQNMDGIAMDCHNRTQEE